MKLNVFVALNIFTLFLLASCATQGVRKPQKPSAENERLTVTQVLEMKEGFAKKLSETQDPDIKEAIKAEIYLKATSLHIEGDYEGSNHFYELLVNEEKDNNYIKRKYAVGLIRQGEMDKSESLLEEVYASSKHKDAEIGLILAGVYSTSGKKDEAMKVYAKILKQDPKNEDACVFYSKLYADQERIKDSLNLLHKCSKADPKNGVYHYYLGKTYLESNNIQKSLQSFKKSLSVDPDMAQAALAIGIIHEEKHEYKSAEVIYRNFLKRHPSNQMILNRLVQAMFIQEKFKEVIPYTERLVDMEPENLNLKVKLGILYTDSEDYENAISVFKDLLQFAPDSDKILYYLGAIYQETENYEDAISVFSRIPDTSGLYSDSTLQIAHMLSALAYYEHENGVERNTFESELISFVKSRYQKIAKLKIDLKLLEASYFERIEDIDRAISSLGSVRKDKSFHDNHKYYLASLYERTQDYKESTKLIMEIVEKNPSHAHAWNFLGYSLLERDQDLDLAFEYIKKAIAISPEDGYIRDSLGWYYFKIGDVTKALKELEVAVKAVPDDVSIQRHLGIAYSVKRDFKRATVYFNKALSLSSDHKEKEEIGSFLKDLEQKRIPASLESKN